MKRIVTLLAMLFGFSGLAVAQTQNVSTDPGGFDPDSFGHSLIYLGLSGSAGVVFDPACGVDVFTPPDRCVPVPDGAPVHFAFEDLGSMVIPANSTKTTIWPMMIDNVNIDFQERTGTVGRARFQGNVIITIESSVLLDPTILDPFSGLPANGKFVASFPSVYGMDQRLSANDYFRLHVRGDGSGINAFTTAVLGLTRSQTKALFSNPITLRWGLSGVVQNAVAGFFLPGFRIMGDK